MATSSSSSRHRRPRLAEQGQPPAAQVPRMEGKCEEDEEEESRDWAELPRDALLSVLRRLDQADVLMGAEHVCRPWRRPAQEEPDQWRGVDLRGRVALASPAGALKAMAYAAARRGAGRCEAFWVKGVRDDSFVFFLSCKDLELSLYSGAATNHGLINLAETCAVAAEACPLLNRLRLSRYRFDWRSGGVGDGEAVGIAGMRGLRSLQIFGNSLSNAGLAAILGGCAGLESLDIYPPLLQRRDGR
ncbi:putative F-box/LRR-repeat protein 22 [Setaria italica]|uniref:putative F-box/LRR-repeat protein 22 n=1 Tax=Setaria italica TaxID=4555 RepID=UPI000350A46A|nr:putative F-box/LRR-repeat protein 22 [Setaria italica]